MKALNHALLSLLVLSSTLSSSEKQYQAHNNRCLQKTLFIASTIMLVVLFTTEPTIHVPKNSSPLQINNPYNEAWMIDWINNKKMTADAAFSITTQNTPRKKTKKKS